MPISNIINFPPVMQLP